MTSLCFITPPCSQSHSYLGIPFHQYDNPSHHILPMWLSLKIAYEVKGLWMEQIAKSNKTPSAKDMI